MLKMVAAALKTFPQFNASLDVANEEVIYKEYVHIGVAVDTERGLLVPVIRDVDGKNIVNLVKEDDPQNPGQMRLAVPQDERRGQVIPALQEELEEKWKEVD